jgi:outer membrane protein OmpA-like peptidoglycan-associated protein
MIGITMNKTVLTLLCACLAPLAHTDNRAATPTDLARIEQLQRQADRLGFAAPGMNRYTLSKARAWLDLALDEYHEKDRSGIVQDASAEAAALLQALQGNPSFEAAAALHPYASEKVRSDLWEQVDAMKRHSEFSCAARKIAELEVQLVWTGHEKWESGWMHAEPYARIAENLAYEAQHALDTCALKHAPHPTSVTPLPPVERIVVEKRTLATDTLFAFDRAGVEYLVPGGRQKLDRLADELKTWKSLERIEFIGHSDRLGADAYNQRLSASRAEHIRQYLTSRGIAADLIEVLGLGESAPVVQCQAQRNRRALIECLQPNRRVELVIQGVPQ